MKINKILFIQKQPLPYAGLLSLAAMLEAHGYGVDIVISSLERNIQTSARQIVPDLICVSAMSMERVWAENIATEIKEALPGIPLVLGGVHAILYPDDAIQVPAVDYVCNSEGEVALLNLVRYLEGHIEDFQSVKGMWRKENGNVIRNDVENLTEDISKYIENREIYYRRYPRMQKDTTKFFIGSRGCPYKCTFCFNAQMQEIFKNSKNYIRYKKPETFIEEIEIEKRKGNLKYICFTDDIFTMDKKWLFKFTELYKERINIPYMCQIRVEYSDEEVLSCLKNSGCDRVMFGLETGNEEIRTRLLNKKIKNDDIHRMSAMLKEYGIKFCTFNIIGLPFESLENSFETIEFNIELKSDGVAAAMYVPFPHTELARRAITGGYLPRDYSFKDIPSSFHRKSIVKMPWIEQQEHVHKVISLLVKYPRIYPAVKHLISSRSRIMHYSIKPLFFMLFIMSYLYRYKSSGNSLLEMIRFMYRFRKSY